MNSYEFLIFAGCFLKPYICFEPFKSNSIAYNKKSEQFLAIKIQKHINGLNRNFLYQSFCLNEILFTYVLVYCWVITTIIQFPLFNQETLAI